MLRTSSRYLHGVIEILPLRGNRIFDANYHSTNNIPLQKLKCFRLKAANMFCTVDDDFIEFLVVVLVEEVLHV